MAALPANWYSTFKLSQNLFKVGPKSLENGVTNESVVFPKIVEKFKTMTNEMTRIQSRSRHLPPFIFQSSKNKREENLPSHFTPGWVAFEPEIRLLKQDSSHIRDVALHLQLFVDLYHLSNRIFSIVDLLIQI